MRCHDSDRSSTCLFGYPLTGVVCRLAPDGARVQLKKPLKEAAVRKFGSSVPHVDRILEAESGVQCVVIGTLYKNMKVAEPRVPRTLPAVTRCAPACVLGATAPFPSVFPSHTAMLSLHIYPSAPQDRSFTAPAHLST